MVDKCSANEPHEFTAQKDAATCAYGPGKANYGRVTLYFNPHDQVISATTIQGIGWRGMNKKEIEDTGAAGVFCQRVFAQGFPVGGEKRSYHFWNDHYLNLAKEGTLKAGSEEFWYPPSPPAIYSIRKGLDTNESFVPKLLTIGTSFVMKLILSLKKVPINGLPDKNWQTPLEAPKLGKNGFLPQAYHLGTRDDKFDGGRDAPGFSRNTARRRDPTDPYGENTPLRPDPRNPKADPGTDAARGNEDTEMSLMYEHHAYLRMRARRDRKEFVGNDGKVTQEDDLPSAGDDYETWRTKEIKTLLADTVNTSATDHSSILTNPDHSEKALAYDIPVGVSHISKEDMRKLRQMADWRFLASLDKSHPMSRFAEYFAFGTMGDKTVAEWLKDPNSGAKLPSGVVNQRTNHNDLTIKDA